MEEVQPLPEQRKGRGPLAAMAAVALAAVLIGDVWLLLRRDTRRVAPPVEAPQDRARRLFDQARVSLLAGASLDDVLPPLDQAIDAAPTFPEARLLRIQLSLPRYLERWAVLDASPLLDRARIPSDIQVARLRTAMLSDAAALGAVSIEDEDRKEVAAIEAFLTDKPVDPGPSPRVRVVRAWRHLLRGEVRSSMKECDVAETPADPLLHWTLAHALLALRREEPWRDAMADQAKEILASLPISAAVLLDLAEADPASERDTLARALALAPGEASILARLAEAEERAGNLPQALAWACQALDAAPDAPGLLLLKAGLQARLVQVHEARETYEHARRWNPDRPDVLRARAAFLLRTGDADRALGDAERAALIEPTQASFDVLCDALVATGQAKQARGREEVWNHASPRARERVHLAIYMEEAVTPMPFGEGDHHALALAAFLKGDIATAGTIAEKLDDPDGWETLARVRVAQGRAAEALDLLLKTLAADPLRAPATALLGQALTMLNRLQEADDALARAVEIDPTCAEAWRVTAELRLAQGDAQKALEALNRAVEHEPGDPDSHALRAEAKRRLRDYDGALADIDVALGTRRAHAPWILLRAEVNLARDDAAAARADAEKACAAMRESAPAWSALARAALAEGDLDAAQKALERAFVLNPRQVVARVCSARLALARSRRDLAQSELGFALQVDPDDADALYLRAKLAIEDARWQDAQADLERFLAKHTSDPRRHEAAGWLDLARKALR